MVLLPWNKLNTFLDILPTKKKFYNRYLYKLTYHVVGAYLISMCKDNTFKSIRGAHNPLDLEKLKVFSCVLKNKEYDLRYRSEGSSLSIFGTSEQELYDLATGRLGAFKSSLRSVTRVQSEEDLAVLEAGCIIMATPTEFRYRVAVKEGWRKRQERQNLGNYLNSIRSEIKISDFLLQGMMTQHKYLTSCYFYVNDPKIVSMIALVAPGVIKRVQEVVIR